MDYGRTGRPVPISGVIDMHGHLGMCRHAIPETNPKCMVAVMDRVGIASVICSSTRCWAPEAAEGNREVLAAMRAFPGRILGYLSVWPADEVTVRDEVDFCLDAGFIGVKVHSGQGFPYTHPGYTPAYERAEEHQLPILFHAWGSESTFEQVGRLARRYPHASLLLAHAGSSNADGYIRMARTYANVFLDTTYSVSPRGMIERLVAGAGADKVVWGSDCDFFSMAQQVGKVLGANIPDEIKVKILSDNPRKILGRRIDTVTAAASELT